MKSAFYNLSCTALVRKTPDSPNMVCAYNLPCRIFGDPASEVRVRHCPKCKTRGSWLWWEILKSDSAANAKAGKEPSNDSTSPTVMVKSPVGGTPTESIATEIKEKENPRRTFASRRRSPPGGSRAES